MQFYVLPPRPPWKPRTLKLNGKFETLTFNLAQRMKRIKSGAKHNPVKRSEKNRGGRFSGSRNM